MESSIDIKDGNNWLSPDGRLDFIPQKMGISFDRSKHNLPKYTSEKDLENILTEILSIYEDIKKEVLDLQ